jgi:hypothetical protein
MLVEVEDDLREGVEFASSPSAWSGSGGRSFSALGDSIGAGSSSSRETSVACEALECSD